MSSCAIRRIAYVLLFRDLLVCGVVCQCTETMKTVVVFWDCVRTGAQRLQSWPPFHTNIGKPGKRQSNQSARIGCCSCFLEERKPAAVPSVLCMTCRTPALAGPYIEDKDENNNKTHTAKQNSILQKP